MNKRAILTVVIIGCVVSCVVGDTCPAEKIVSGDDFRFDYVLDDDLTSTQFFHSAPVIKGDNTFQANPFRLFLGSNQLANNEPFVLTHVELRFENTRFWVINGEPQNVSHSWPPHRLISDPLDHYSGLPDKLKGVGLRRLTFGCVGDINGAPCTMTVIGIQGCKGDWCPGLSLSDFIYSPTSELAPPVKGNNTYQTPRDRGLDLLVFQYRLPNETSFTVSDIELQLENVSDLYIIRIFQDGSVHTERTHSPGQAYNGFPAAFPNKPVMILHIFAETSIGNLATITVKKLTALKWCTSDMG